MNVFDFDLSCFVWERSGQAKQLRFVILLDVPDFDQRWSYGSPFCSYCPRA